MTATELARSLVDEPRLSWPVRIALRRELERRGILEPPRDNSDDFRETGFFGDGKRWIAVWNHGDPATLFRARAPRDPDGPPCWHVRKFCAPDDCVSGEVVPDFDSNKTRNPKTDRFNGFLCMNCGRVRNLRPGVNIPKRSVIEKNSSA